MPTSVNIKLYKFVALEAITPGGAAVINFMQKVNHTNKHYCNHYQSIYSLLK